ncbi:TetR/AcrR family transcriptional regulator [Azospirillum rugosum]|uniref:TetR/AcrR family transcriptional repressor of nem operon n=1 Tax=Azospirillum rugosum TaxID=416170 RepID=A0ABS4SVD7_9PROT|nr:TetR/AcrR family transcriptional regulator [Azospirillum rugosum]MBP2296533.1 TetR/AcrR family transcriptional repressor of nem operon [Azospirillum rugosum]MDQ0530067.1 TetR/AcrR family transcriptional repressor of nem operon [Azospirillum rugosum]
MRVSREKAAENRRRIVDVAGALFREKGFNGIGVADLMKEAGLTHGGFYGHFASKDDLAAEACATAMSGAAERWATLAEEKPAEALATLTGNYLSARHRDNITRGCPIATLGGDVVRQPEPVRRAFTDGLRPFIDVLTRLLPGETEEERRAEALAALSEMVGAVILARAVDDPELSDAILAAAANHGPAVPLAERKPVGKRRSKAETTPDA